MNDQYICRACKYSTYKHSNYQKHLSTEKHQSKINQTPSASFVKPLFVCECGRCYQFRSGFYRHKKKCLSGIQRADPVSTETIKELIQDNKELRNALMKQCQTIKELSRTIVHAQPTNTTNITTTTHNHVTLQFFLNDHCKNAMNMADFIDSIRLQLSDLKRVGELGFVEGISSIITSHLRSLDVTLRPVHCTDLKRETMYIKDQGAWERETHEHTRLKQAVTQIADKNVRLFPLFREKNPEHCDANSHCSDQYDKIVMEVMGGTGDEKKKMDKIINNIARSVPLNKFTIDI